MWLLEWSKSVLFKCDNGAFDNIMNITLMWIKTSGSTLSTQALEYSKDLMPLIQFIYLFKNLKEMYSNVAIYKKKLD